MKSLIRAIWLPSFFLLIFLMLSAFLTLNGFIVGTIFLFGVLFFGLDLVGRFNDYQHISKTTYKKKLYWELFSKTRCSREVMVAVDPRAKDYYKLAGYKWYHFFPDNYKDCLSISFLQTLHRRHKIPK